MTDAPEQIWIAAFGGNWSPCSGGTQDVEYVRADLHRSLALDALASETQAADAYAAQLKAEAMAEKLATVLRAFQNHESANYFGPDAIKNASAVMRGIRRKIKAALAEHEASK